MSEVLGYTNFPNRKTVEVGKDCVGFVVTLTSSLQGKDVNFDVKSVKDAFDKEFPGKALVVLNGLEVQPIYANDAAFKRAVAEAVAEIVDKKLIEVHKRHHDEVGKAVLKQHIESFKFPDPVTFAEKMLPQCKLTESQKELLRSVDKCEPGPSVVVMDEPEAEFEQGFKQVGGTFLPDNTLGNVADKVVFEKRFDPSVEAANKLLERLGGVKFEDANDPKWGGKPIE